MDKELILFEMSLYKSLGLCILSAIYLDIDTAGLFKHWPHPSQQSTEFVLLD